MRAIQPLRPNKVIGNIIGIRKDRKSRNSLSNLIGTAQSHDTELRDSQHGDEWNNLTEKYWGEEWDMAEWDSDRLKNIINVAKDFKRRKGMR